MKTLIRAILWPLRALAGLLLTAWTTPEEVAAGSSYSSTDHNAQVVNNLLHLYLPPAGEVTLSGSISTTSTSFTDATGMTVTLTTTGRDVRIGGQAIVNCSNNRQITVTVLRDGTNLGNATNGLAAVKPQGSDVETIPFSFLDPEPAAGSHTYKVQWKVETGDHQADMYAGSHLFVREN